MNIKEAYNHLRLCPNDFDYRSVFADWLFEHNNPLERVQRWLIANKKYPMLISTSEFIFGSLRHYPIENGAYLDCCIDYDIIKNFPHYNIKKHHWMFFDNILAAETALNEILIKKNL